MPIFDYDNEFTVLGGQGPIIATAFTLSTKALDGAGGNPSTSTTLGVRDWGAGEPIRVYGRVTQAFNNLTSLDVQVGGADDNAGTNFVVYVTTNFLLAALALNALLAVGVLRGGQTKKRFLLGKFVVNGIAPTTGKVILGLVDWRAATQDGFNTLG
jgi:hypothetical protein